MGKSNSVISAGVGGKTFRSPPSMNPPSEPSHILSLADVTALNIPVTSSQTSSSLLSPHKESDRPVMC